MSRSKQKARKKAGNRPRDQARPQGAAPQGVQKPTSKKSFKLKDAGNPNYEKLGSVPFLLLLLEAQRTNIDRSKKSSGDSSSSSSSSSSSDSSSSSSSDSGNETPTPSKSKAQNAGKDTDSRRILLELVNSFPIKGSNAPWRQCLTDEGKQQFELRRFWNWVRSKGLKWAPRYDQAMMDEIMVQLEKEVDLRMSEWKAKGNLAADFSIPGTMPNMFSNLNNKWEAKRVASKSKGFIKQGIKDLEKEFAEHELRARVEWAISEFVKVKKA